MVAARVKEKATDKVLEKVAKASAHSPVAAELGERRWRKWKSRRTTS